MANGSHVDLQAIRAALQQKNAFWQAAPSALTELPFEALRRRLGFVPGPGAHALPVRESMARAAAARRPAATAAAPGPTEFDHRSIGGMNYLSTIRDQGDCGSCVSFGTLGAVEGTLRRQVANPSLPVDLSEAQLFYCHGRAAGRFCSGPNGGWWPDGALQAMAASGVADETCYPYTAGDQNCSNLCADWAGRATKVSNWRELTSIADMKSHLVSTGPLIACFSVYSDFFAYKSGVYHHVSGTVQGGHCVACVGFRDADECWICRNSWGPGWGENGYFRIKYAEVGIDASMWTTGTVIPAGRSVA